METSIQVKIKMENGTEIVVNQDEAKELFEKLGEIFEKDIEYISIPYYRDFTSPSYYTGDTLPLTTWAILNSNCDIKDAI